MNRYLFIFLLSLAGCASYNNPIANYSVIKDGYKITLTGKRSAMPHAYSMDYRLVLLVPRIQGEVLGQEIPVKEGYYNYLGRIEFLGEEMKLDLYLDDYDRKLKDPLDWNGRYKLNRE